MLVLRMNSDGDFPQVRIHGCLIPGGFVGAEPAAVTRTRCAPRATAAVLAEAYCRKQGRTARVTTAVCGVRTRKRILHGRLIILRFLRLPLAHAGGTIRATHGTRQRVPIAIRALPKLHAYACRHPNGGDSNGPGAGITVAQV